MNIPKEKVESVIEFLEKFTGTKLESYEKRILANMFLDKNMKFIIPRQMHKRTVYITR